MCLLSMVTYKADSPSSQYRNKFNAYLPKYWAVQNGINLYWVFTETGHGKGSMDGVGATRIFWAYSFIINKITRSLNIFFCNWSKREIIDTATFF